MAIALFLVNVMLGLMARVAPQMNVFVVGFPIQITVGLIMLIVTSAIVALANRLRLGGGVRLRDN